MSQSVIGQVSPCLGTVWAVQLCDKGGERAKEAKSDVTVSFRTAEGELFPAEVDVAYAMIERWLPREGEPGC